VQNELGIENNKLNKYLSFHRENVQLLYGSQSIHLNLRISPANQWKLTKGVSDCLRFISPGSFRIEPLS